MRHGAAAGTAPALRWPTRPLRPHRWQRRRRRRSPPLCVRPIRAGRRARRGDGPVPDGLLGRRRGLRHRRARPDAASPDDLPDGAGGRRRWWRCAVALGDAAPPRERWRAGSAAQERAAGGLYAAGTAGAYTCLRLRLRLRRFRPLLRRGAQRAPKCPLGSASARLLRLLRAHLAALGSSVRPGGGRPIGRPATASAARASRLRRRRFHRL